jgi:hypothetical protein
MKRAMPLRDHPFHEAAALIRARLSRTSATAEFWAMLRPGEDPSDGAKRMRAEARELERMAKADVDWAP